MSRWSPVRAVGEREPAFFGFRVHPITVGHLRLCHELELDTWSDDPADAMFAACLCSQPHADSRSDVARWWFRPLVAWRARQVGKALAMRSEQKRWREWLEYQVIGPSAKVRSAPGKTSSRGSLAAPLHVNLTSCLMGSLHMSHTDAESLPVKTARQLLAAFHEAAGNVELWTDLEYAFEESCRRADARRMASQQPAGRN